MDYKISRLALFGCLILRPSVCVVVVKSAKYTVYKYDCCRYDGVKDKVSNQNVQLQQLLNDSQGALLAMDNYKDSLGSLQNWLEETEELLANQQSPSTDHKVVKAQLDEQKLLQKLIEDKQSAIVGFLNLGEQVEQSITNDDEKDKIRDEINHVSGR